MSSHDDLYRDLQRHLDRMPVPFPATQSGVEIRILKQLFSREEASLVLALSMIAEPASVVHRRLHDLLTIAQVRATLDGMAERGLIVRTGRGDGARYGKLPFVVGFYEGQVNRLTADLERDFLQYLDEGLAAALLRAKTPQMRTVPVHQALPVPERPVARYDDIRQYVRGCEGPFAVMNCICQQGRDLLGEACRVTADREHCLTLGSAARMVVEHDAGRFITRDETLAFLDRADRDGLVLQPQNTQRPLFVCCCCGCCCGVLTAAKKVSRPAEFFGTNYQAEVASAACQGCGSCVPRCQMDAVTCDTGTAVVDLSRCIGCGLCVSSCPSDAMHLVAKGETKVPPADMMYLYARMYRQRYGPLALVAAMGRKLLGLRT